jgi:RNA polymerase sigma-70 factor (ECF subfamily)
MAESSDEQLYADWVGGDQDAGRRLIGRRLEGMRRLMRTLLSGPEYDDAVQEVFERLARRAKEGGRIDNVKAFTAGIAYNVVREQLRERSDAIDLASHSLADLRPNVSAELVQREDQKLLLKALHRLPVDDQILLGLRYWERLRSRELADIIGANHSTVRTRLQRAEAKLQKLIEELADSPDAVLSTIGSLTGWARGVREQVDGSDS